MKFPCKSEKIAKFDAFARHLPPREHINVIGNPWDFQSINELCHPSSDKHVYWNHVARFQLFESRWNPDIPEIIQKVDRFNREWLRKATAIGIECFLSIKSKKANEKFSSIDFSSMPRKRVTVWGQNKWFQWAAEGEISLSSSTAEDSKTSRCLIKPAEPTLRLARIFIEEHWDLTLQDSKKIAKR